MRGPRERHQGQAVSKIPAGNNYIPNGAAQAWAWAKATTSVRKSLDSRNVRGRGEGTVRKTSFVLRLDRGSGVAKRERVRWRERIRTSSVSHLRRGRRHTCDRGCVVGIKGVSIRMSVKASCMRMQVDIEGMPLGPEGTRMGIEGARGVERMRMSMNVAGEDMSERDVEVEVERSQQRQSSYQWQLLTRYLARESPPTRVREWERWRAEGLSRLLEMTKATRQGQ